MKSKLGPESFDQYVKLGRKRSYEALAKLYGTSKRSVTRFATKNRWTEKLKAATIEKVDSSINDLNTDFKASVERIVDARLRVLLAEFFAT